jgi:hypothetical protein
VGNTFRDNSYDDDGYRFHDVFHFAYAAVLGWSPVVRAILSSKRRSTPQIDEIEDGGRAIAIEEAIAAFVFDNARKFAFFENIETVDYSMLKIIKSLTAGLEVRARASLEWEKAILDGFKIWRRIQKNRGGILSADLSKGTISLVSK